MDAAQFRLQHVPRAHSQSMCNQTRAEAAQARRARRQEWNEKVLNALAQVSAGYRKGLKNLNNKLESMDGVLDEYEDNMARILSGRLTAAEYTRASLAKRQEDGDPADFDFDSNMMAKLDEDLWRILNDRVDGVEPRGKLKGIARRRWAAIVPEDLQSVLRRYWSYFSSQDELGHERGQAKGDR